MVDFTCAMAWGYWNATSAADRGRSPRRSKEISQESTTTHQRHTHQVVQNVVELPPEEPVPIPQETTYTTTITHNTTQVSEVEFDPEQHNLSRYSFLVKKVGGLVVKV